MELDLSRHNRKDQRPSRNMTPGDGTPLVCPWIEDSVTILSDGSVTCGLDDTDGLRSFGNIHDQSLTEIFANPEYEHLREGLQAGRKCRDCALYQPLTGTVPPRHSLPRRLVVEPTIRCNLRCPQIACFANNSAEHQTRDSDELPRGVLDRSLAELGPALEQVYFFNYGDPFMHRDAPQMIADIRRHSPDAQIVTSTNGIPLAGKQKAQQLVDARLDHIVFTISGLTQESYARYHVNGRLETALLGMRRLVEARRTAGSSYPKIAWRYLAFRWTDTFEELDAAIALAKELEITDFSIYLTHIPEDGWSYRLAEGTPGHARYRRWINVAYGYNRHPAPKGGLFEVETMPLFGTARWTNWRANVTCTQRDGMLDLWLSTNSPAAHVQGFTQILVRTPWRQMYRVDVPYCRWGLLRLPVPASRYNNTSEEVELACPDAWFPKDWLGVEDYRCLGVLVTALPDGTIPQEAIVPRPAHISDHVLFARTRNGDSLSPVASALFQQFTAKPKVMHGLAS